MKLDEGLKLELMLELNYSVRTSRDRVSKIGTSDRDRAEDRARVRAGVRVRVIAAVVARIRIRAKVRSRAKARGESLR